MEIGPVRSLDTRGAGKGFVYEDAKLRVWDAGVWLDTGGGMNRDGIVSSGYWAVCCRTHRLGSERIWRTISGGRAGRREGACGLVRVW